MFPTTHFIAKRTIIKQQWSRDHPQPGQMPGGYTGNYMFEFDAGVCTYRQLATTPDAEAQQVSLLPAGWPAERVRDLISSELFGSTDPKEWTMQNVTLPNAAPKEMTAKKLKSLAKKYCTIPVEYRPYYPDVTDVDGRGHL